MSCPYLTNAATEKMELPISVLGREMEVLGTMMVDYLTNYDSRFSSSIVVWVRTYEWIRHSLHELQCIVDLIILERAF